MISIIDLLGLSVKNLLRRKLRSWLTILGIVIGISSLIVLISISYGMEKSVENILTRMGKDKLIILPGKTSGFLGSLFVGEPFSEVEINKLEKLSSIEELAPVITSSVVIRYQNKVTGAIVRGFPVKDDLIKFGFSLYRGRMFKSSDKNKCYVILGYLFAKQAFSTEINVGDKLWINGQECRVIGILNPTGGQFEDFSVFLPFSTLKNKFGIRDVRTIFVIAKDVDKAKKDIKRVLHRTRGDSFTVMTAGQLLNYSKQILNLLSFIVIAIASISLIVSAIGIMNTMYMSVTERIREIGILKAIGAKNYEVALIFLLESGLIGMIGGVIGSILGIIAAKIVEKAAIYVGITTFTAVFNLWYILGAIGLSFIVGIISGVAPSINAAKLDPIVALRME